MKGTDETANGKSGIAPYPGRKGPGRKRPAPIRPGPVALAAIGLIQLYRYTLSPALAAIGVNCRHAPTCSHYACEAYRRHGAWRGSWLTLSRLSRCHPFGSSGFDPVPGRLGNHRFAPWRYGDWSWRARGGEAREDGAAAPGD